MYLLYNLLLCLFLLCGWPLLLLYMYQRQGSLAGLAERLGLGLPEKKRRGGRKNGRTTWFHGASVGEVRMLAPLVKTWLRKFPDDEIMVTTMTVTGRQTAAEIFPGTRVGLLPLDFPWVWGGFFRTRRPDRLVIAETELWPNLLKAAGKHGLPVALVNARLSEKSFANYRRFAFFTRRMFALPDLVVVQDEESGRRFRELGTPAGRVVFCGNMKFDLDYESVDNERYRGLFPPESPVMVAGSTHPGEEELLLTAWNRALEAVGKEFSGMVERACLVLAPRHPQRFPEVAARLEKLGIDFVPFSRLKKNSSQPRLEHPPKVLLLDTLGDLAAFYPLGRAALIGGTLIPGIGGHNPLEAAVCGRAVIHGPHTASFRDGFRFLDEQGGGLTVADVGELEKLQVRFFREPEWIWREGEKAAATMRRQRGAVTCTMARLEALFAGS